jgi:hypothetical protein
MINLAPQTLFVINFFCCAYMTGLIWLIQVVHYPLFSMVSPENFTEYSTKHANSITPIVAIPMIIELITSFVLLFSLPNWVTNQQAIFLFVIILLIFASTFFIQVPLHNTLQLGYNKELISKLVFSNWIRTVLWTAKSVIMIYLLTASKSSS